MKLQRVASILGVVLVVLLSAAPIEVKAVRKDTPVILDTTVYSDWAYIYKIDLPVKGTYDLFFSCGMNEDATLLDQKGPAVLLVKITVNVPKTQSCYISSWNRKPEPK